MKPRSVTFALVLFLWPLAIVAGAQDEKKSEGKEPPAEKQAQTAEQRFATLFQMWNDVDGKLRKIIVDYRAAQGEQRQKLYDEYQELVRQSRGIVPELHDASVACYKKKPNADRDVTRTIVGLMFNANRSFDFETVKDLGKLLADNKCEEKAYLGEYGAAMFCLDEIDAATSILEAAETAGSLSALAKTCVEEMKVRENEKKADDLPRVELATSKGKVVLELFENEAPIAVANFISLVEKPFYDGLTFHRVLDGFVAQGGCPKGDGTGGPGYQIPCECEKDGFRRHFRGSLSMAHAGKDTGGSQFFIVFARSASAAGLDGRHTVFGQVIEGMDVVDKLQRIDPSQPDAQADAKVDKIVSAVVVRKREHPYKPTKVEAPPKK